MSATGGLQIGTATTFSSNAGMFNPIGVFSRFTNAIQNPSITSGVRNLSGPALYVMYALIGGIIVALILLTVDYFHPFLPFNSFNGPSSVARAGKRFWTNTGAGDENLIVPAKDSPTVQPGMYSMSIDMVIGDSRSPSDNMYRHIVHRGSNPCGLSVGTPGSSGHAGIKREDLPKPGEQSYNELSLPQVMNPGVFLDNYKNDIHIFIHTKGKEGELDVLWLESLTIEDLPLNMPLTLGIVCTGASLEVYLNCQLYSTMLLKGKPYLPKADNQWFGRYCVSPFTGSIKNLTLWDAPLGSHDFILMCRGANFDGVTVPKGCANPVGTSSQAVGYDVSRNK